MMNMQLNQQQMQQLASVAMASNRIAQGSGETFSRDQINQIASIAQNFSKQVEPQEEEVKKVKVQKAQDDQEESIKVQKAAEEKDDKKPKKKVKIDLNDYMDESKKLTDEEEVVFIDKLARLTRDQAIEFKNERVASLAVEMPLTFSNMKLYLDKLSELVLNEANYSRLETEIVAEKDVEFEFEERLDIYSKLRLRVSKQNQKHLRENALLRVMIPQLRVGRDRPGMPYVGTGTIKKVIVARNDPMLTIIFQLDILNPLDRNSDQSVPDKRLRYERSLSFRLVYDDSQLHANLRQIRENLGYREQAGLWTDIPYTVQRLTNYFCFIEVTVPPDPKASRQLRFNELLVLCKEELLKNFVGVIKKVEPKRGGELKLTIEIRPEDLMNRHPA